MNKHSLRQTLYAIGAISSIGLVCVSIVGFFVEDEPFDNAWGLAYGAAVGIASIKWFRDGRRNAAAKQQGGAA